MTDALERPERPARRRNPRRAFTLIELLLVLVILSVLAAVVVPKFAGRSKQARITAAVTQIEYLETSLALFEIDVGRYPTTQEGLQALVEEPAGVKDWYGSYLGRRVVPNDPWGNPYVYKSPGQHNTDGYDLYSLGPDGQEGSDDDIDNWSER